MTFPTDINNHRENRYANGVNYVFEWLSDGWIAIWQQRADLTYRPLIQAKTEEKAIEYITFREAPKMPLSRLV